ncbi:hypothetical protein P7L91_02280, partial [Bisgaard Taxon 10/6]|nr:hypothetical protein [Exercitatus varius]
EWASNRAQQFEKLCRVFTEQNQPETAQQIRKLAENLSIGLKVRGFDTDKEAYFIHPLGMIGCLAIHSECIPLREAKEIALKVSGAYEGKGGFANLSDNFDGMGMSWGIIQFNFGQNTLGPLLNKMKAKNITAFNECFSNKDDLTNLNKALSGTVQEQINWAINMQSKNNRSRWINIFNNLANIKEFQDIQIENSSIYTDTAINIINWMRVENETLMKHIELRTFVALVDLAVQQGNIKNVKDSIKARCLATPPKTQYEFVKIVVEERGATAKTRWRADCISRRLGILNREVTAYTHSGYNAKRENKNFNLIKDGYICEL